jgi:hypothetical protein
MVTNIEASSLTCCAWAMAIICAACCALFRTYNTRVNEGSVVKVHLGGDLRLLLRHHGLLPGRVAGGQEGRRPRHRGLDQRRWGGELCNIVLVRWTQTGRMTMEKAREISWSM